MRMKCRQLILAGFVGLSASGCDATPPELRPGPPAAVSIVDGQSQSGVAGTQLALPLRVRVTDSTGRSIPNWVVTFHVTQGGGSVFSGAAMTSAEGIAVERWTLGTSTADSQRVEVRAVREDGAPVVFAEFRATALADAPVAIAKAAAAEQSIVGTSIPVAVRGTDRYGNGVPGSTVQWEAAHGAVAAGQSVTGSDGLASVNWTLGTVATSQSLTARCCGLDPVQIHTSAGPGGPATIQVTPASPSTVVRVTTTLSATVRDSFANAVPVEVAWSSANPTVAIVSAGGVVTGVNPGTTQIVATAGAAVGSATVTVAPAPVASLQVLAGTARPIRQGTSELQFGDSAQFSAVPFDAFGIALDGRGVAWSSSNPAVATVSSAGWVRALSAGSAIITATSEGVSASHTVDVMHFIIGPAPITLPALDTMEVFISRYPDPTPYALCLPVTFTSSDTSVVRVIGTSNSTGSARIEGRAQGSATLVGHCLLGDLRHTGTATTQVTVTAPRPRPVATVEVSSATAVSSTMSIVQFGDSVQFSAVLRDAAGSVLTGRSVTWTSSGSGVAVSSSGMVRGMISGDAVVTATSEGVNGTETARVVHVVLDPATLALSPGDSAVVAIRRMPEMSQICRLTASWSSSDSSRVAIRGAGSGNRDLAWVRAIAPGGAEVRGSCSISSDGTYGVAKGSVTVQAP